MTEIEKLKKENETLKDQLEEARFAINYVMSMVKEEMKPSRWPDGGITKVEFDFADRSVLAQAKAKLEE